MIDLGFRWRELCTQDCLSSGKTEHFLHFFPTRNLSQAYYCSCFHESIPKILGMSIIKEKCMVDFTWEELADGRVGMWNQRSSLIAVSQISRAACCSGDSEFTRKDFREDTWGHSLLILTESEHSLLPPPPWLANKKPRISQSCVHLRWSIPVLRTIGITLRTHWQWVKHPKFLQKLIWRKELSRGSHRAGLCGGIMFIIFVESLDLSHSGSRTRDVFLCYLAECLAWRHTERWIKTFNTQGQNLLVLIRGKGSFGSFCHYTKEPSSCLSCWLLCSGCMALRRKEKGIRAHMACNAQ